MTVFAPGPPAARPVQILVAEDNLSDRLILREAFDELGANVDLCFVDDGEALLDHLHGRSLHSQDQGSLHPALILMDLNMPRMNGNEALRALRADSVLRLLPVIVLSTSDNPRQIAQAYENGANAFMTKPGPFDDIVDMLRRFSAFWLECAALPRSPASDTP